MAKEVYLSGSFNSWQPIRMNLSESNFYCVLELPEGNHEYKFKVDGVWQHNNKEPVTRYVKNDQKYFYIDQLKNPDKKDTQILIYDFSHID